MKIDLLGGDVQQRGANASNQRRLNVYTEAAPRNQGEPFVTSILPTPGLELLATTPNSAVIRCLYKATDGDLYCVAGPELYYVDSSWTFHAIGSVGNSGNLVKMSDNGKNVIIVDGSSAGWSVNMATRSDLKSLVNVPDPDGLGAGFYGSTYADYSDTYFVCNKPGTPIWYISDSEATTFSTSQFASKVGQADLLVAAIVQHRVVWLIGTLSTEVWYNTGGQLFAGDNYPYSIMPGVMHDTGCSAPYSIAKGDMSVFWLGQNVNGQPVVMQAAGYGMKRISNHGLENVMSGYADLTDAIGFCYMQQGHTFYVLTFPSADATWVHDVASDLWHEWSSFDTTGAEHRHRATCHAFAYDTNVVNDFNNGNLYALSLSAFSDNGEPIRRVIDFPRSVDPEDNARVEYKSLTIDCDTGESVIPGDTPLITLRWSDDMGKTWSNAIEMPLGQMGQYGRTIRFQRLGAARNRRFRLEWSANALTAISGAYVLVDRADA